MAIAGPLRVAAVHPLMPVSGNVLDDLRFVIHPSPRAISLWQEVMGSSPFTDTAAGLQSVFAC